MDNIINLGSARAEKSQDSKDWTAVDCVRQLLADIESGKTNPKEISIGIWEKNDLHPGELFHVMYSAGMSTADHLFLLEVTKQRVLEIGIEKER